MCGGLEGVARDFVSYLSEEDMLFYTKLWEALKARFPYQQQYDDNILQRVMGIKQGTKSFDEYCEELSRSTLYMTQKWRCPR
ncbi:hypothetical protein N7492_009169 [Penicillium capsulatum]|uniref:WAC domain-containing protein n=1 Tax=Penicillium capsulatum TaxID=69766 RepID=A0A9W9HUV7_9EURO|nr:hypothetical protein N7492_009169 [Penicillium capsulatum]KAJ6106568.1 hypothetical protein N7512_010085 [Penicillium capsulatum]